MHAIWPDNTGLTIWGAADGCPPQHGCPLLQPSSALVHAPPPSLSPVVASPVGDRVFALTHRCVGAYTSRIVLPEAALARIPEGKSFEDAAAFPLAALTAWQVC